MGYTAVILDKQNLTTDIPVRNLNRANISIKLDGQEIGAIPYITGEGMLQLYFPDSLVIGGLLTVRIDHEVYNIALNETSLSKIAIFTQHSIETQKEETNLYEKTDLFQESMNHSVDNQLPIEYSTVMDRSSFRLSGSAVHYDFEMSDDFSINRYFDILAVREINQYSGMYEGGRVVSMESGGIHFLRYGFDPNSSKPRFVHKMEEKPSKVMINGGLIDLDAMESFEDGFYLPYTANSFQKISIYDTMDRPIPIVLNLRWRLF